MAPLREIQEKGNAGGRTQPRMFIPALNSTTFNTAFRATTPYVVEILAESEGFEPPNRLPRYLISSWPELAAESKPAGANLPQNGRI